MKKIMLLLWLLISVEVFAQSRVLVLGNSSKICLPKDTAITFEQSETLPDTLNFYDALLIFSTAHSSLTGKDVQTITNYLHSGGGLYIGCENWPLLSEGNQLTEAILNKQFWGEHTSDSAVLSENTKVFSNYAADPNAGRTAVFFPLDPRMRVEIWAGDEPLILSSEEFGGRLILDGGYSRFYCADPEDSVELLNAMLQYLTIH